MNLLLPQTTFNPTSLNEEAKSKIISEVSNYRDELATVKNIPKERLNFINHKLLISESRLGTRVRAESFKENFQEDLLYRAENMVAAGVAGIIAMLLAFFLNKDSGSSGGGGGGGGRSTETLKKIAEVKAEKKAEKVVKATSDSGEFTVVIKNPGYYRENKITEIEFGKELGLGLGVLEGVAVNFLNNMNICEGKLKALKEKPDDPEILAELFKELAEKNIENLNLKDNTADYKTKYDLPDFDSAVELIPVGYPCGDTYWNKTPFFVKSTIENSHKDTEIEFKFLWFDSKHPAEKNDIVWKFSNNKDPDIKEMAKVFEHLSKKCSTMLEDIKNFNAGLAEKLENVEKKFEGSSVETSRIAKAIIKTTLGNLFCSKSYCEYLEKVFLHIHENAEYLKLIPEFKTDQDGNFVI